MTKIYFLIAALLLSILVIINVYGLKPALDWLGPVAQNALGGLIAAVLLAGILSLLGSNVALKATVLDRGKGIDERIKLELIQGRITFVVRIANNFESKPVGKYVTAGNSIDVPTFGTDFTNGVIYYRSFPLFGRVRSSAYGSKIKPAKVYNERWSKALRDVEYYLANINSCLGLALEASRLLKMSENLEGRYLIAYSLLDYHLHFSFNGPVVNISSNDKKLSLRALNALRSSKAFSSGQLTKLNQKLNSLEKTVTKDEFKSVVRHLWLNIFLDFRLHKAAARKLTELELTKAQMSQAVCLGTGAKLSAKWTINNNIKCLRLYAISTPENYWESDFAITTPRVIDFDSSGFLVRGTETNLSATGRAQRARTVWLYFDRASQVVFACYNDGVSKQAPMSELAISELESKLKSRVRIWTRRF